MGTWLEDGWITYSEMKVAMMSCMCLRKGQGWGLAEFMCLLGVARFGEDGGELSMPFSCKVSDQGASFRFLGEGTEAEEVSDLSPMADRGRSGLRPSRCMSLEHGLWQCSFWLREAEATLCRLPLPVTLSPEFTFTCFYF